MCSFANDGLEQHSAEVILKKYYFKRLSITYYEKQGINTKTVFREESKELDSSSAFVIFP